MNNQICYNIWKVFYSIDSIVLFLFFIPVMIIKNVIGVIGAIPLVGLLIDFLLAIIWCVLQVPLFLFAGLSKMPGVGFIFAAIGIPVAVLVSMIFNCLPSFARLRDPSDIKAHVYYRKSIIVDSYPFCIEFSQMDTQDPKSPQFYKILDFFKTQYPLNLFLTEFSTDKKEVVDSSPEKEEVTESGKLQIKKEVIDSSPEKEEVTESGKIKEESLYNVLALLKKGDDEFADFMAPYVTGYFNNIKIFDEEKIRKIFYVFKVFLSYILKSAQQTDEDNLKIKTAVGTMVVNRMLRMQGIDFLSLSESDAIKFEDFFHSKFLLVIKIFSEFTIGVNNVDKLSFIEFIMSNKSEKPKTFSECVCKVFAENWLKEYISTQISKNENDATKIIKDYFNSLTHDDFAIKSPRLKPDEVRQRVNAIEEMQQKAKEQKDEEQFDLFIAAVLGLVLAVIALLVIGFTTG